MGCVEGSGDINSQRGKGDTCKWGAATHRRETEHATLGRRCRLVLLRCARMSILDGSITLGSTPASARCTCECE